MKQELEQTVKSACKDLFSVDVELVLTRPNERFGDFATNIALHLAKQIGKTPREIAEVLATNIKGQSSSIEEATVAGPGFLNLRLHDAALVELAKSKPAQTLKGQSIVFEYPGLHPQSSKHFLISTYA